MRKRKLTASILALSLSAGLVACGTNSQSVPNAETKAPAESTEAETEAVATDSKDLEESSKNTTEKLEAKTTSTLDATTADEKSTIEDALNLAKNTEVTWSYDSESDSWTMSITSAVANPELPDYQGVSVNVPGAYIKGIDTDGDGKEDVTKDNYSDAVNGTLIIDYDAEITNENGQTYTAATAPVVINTGAAGYSAQENKKASSGNAQYGYINVACGNRGKQSTATDADGNEYFTGDAPLCLVDQKNAIRYVKYNILLGNLPGNVEYFVSTGGSGGGAHAAMVAATSNNSNYYDYEIEAGAVGVYVNEDGSYSTVVSIDGKDTSISDGVWGCVAYSAITSLQEADMAMAFEYYLDKDYDFNTAFQKQLAEYLSAEYMDYINDQNLTIDESEVGFDINGDGDTDDVVDLTIEYDEDKYADTNGYGGTYLNFYLCEFHQNLEWYLDNIDYAEDWTWFNEDGTAMSDDEVAAMTTEDKAQAFLEGRYTKSSSGGMGGPDGAGGPGGMAGGPGNMGGAPDGNGGAPADMGGAPDGNGGAPADMATEEDDTVTSGMGSEVGTPDAGTTQSASSKTDSSNYSTYDEMVEAYAADIASIQAGDKYGNNIVDLYDPIKAIGAETTEAPTWTRILMGAAEGDMSMFASLNLQIAWLNNGTDANVEWQWDGGHVPSEIFGSSLALYIDEMYGEYVDGATKITKAAAEKQTTNGTSEEASGKDISDWASYKDGVANFTLADAVSYRTSGANKATPGFDVIDYGQETYEFGDSENDSRHFDKYLLKVLEENADVLKDLFNKAE